MTIKGSEITVGTTLRWFVEVGQYYRATNEVLWVVDNVFVDNFGRKVMNFAQDTHRHNWVITDDKEYETESENRVWLDGDPNNPL